ncbi:hypothetical protein UFOVP729_52 [uncultured Caudovirales phage]|uniref:Uncharacterized protein n=1 Tax=uncultured Caudovirales phage TaxID=2100421 RepID=A0A6J5P1P5_9CAUD|nr:hypothetical protein UFOVP729_52 [uncultured Caudovirales phage]
MTRASTWTNADGLIVGFGANIPERNVAGVYDTDGAVKEAHLAVTYQSSGANIEIPAGSVVLDVVLEVGTAWAGGTKVELGDGTDPDGWISATQGAVANLTTGATIVAGGAYAIGDAATNRGLGKVYASADTLDVAITGSFTAGTGTFIVRYI